MSGSGGLCGHSHLKQNNNPQGTTFASSGLRTLRARVAKDVDIELPSHRDTVLLLLFYLCIYLFILT